MAVVGSPHDAARHASPAGRCVLHGVEVVREGRVEPFLHTHPMLSSAAADWAGLALEEYSVPSCVIPRHEHVEHFVHVVLHGSVKYEVLTRGKTLQFTANPGTTFVLPRGTIDEIRWMGRTHRIAAAIHPSLFVNALDETACDNDIELIEHWNLMDSHILAVMRAMATDLAEGSPAGRLYGETLGNAVAVYLLKRYTIRRRAPVAYRGGLPGYRLRRVLDYIGDNLSDDLSLSELASVAGMSAHYFAELFRESTGHSPHRYVLLQRIEHAKQSLCERGNSVIEAALAAGFENPSHFARVFRKYVGTSPSRFQSEMARGGR